MRTVDFVEVEVLKVYGFTLERSIWVATGRLRLRIGDGAVDRGGVSVLEAGESNVVGGVADSAGLYDAGGIAGIGGA